MSSKDHIDIRGAFDDRLLILLRHTAADCNLEVGIGFLERSQETEIAVELIVCILADGTGIKDDQVWSGTLESRFVPSVQEKPSYTLGIVHIHLTAVGLYDEGACAHWPILRG